MLVEGEEKEIAEQAVNFVFEKVGEVAEEVNVKRVRYLFALISVIGHKRLTFLREEIIQCQKIK